MIKLNDKLINQILESLGNSFPNYISSSQILPKHEDRKEIDKHVVYCEGRGWIMPVEKQGNGMMSDGSVRLGGLFRITSQGIDYLSEQTR